MAIFHLEAKIIGGKNSVLDATHACAYRHRIKIEGHGDYSHKGGLLRSFFLKPKSLNLLHIEPVHFWKAVGEFENKSRKDSQRARELQISLHKELSLEENENLLLSFIEEEFISRGMIADIVIHQPKENPDNIHAHVMLSLREITLNEKDITFGKKRRDWNDRNLLLKWREKWECKSNEILSSKGVDKITSKSYSTLYEEAKKNNDIKNMELYSNLMRFRTHFSSKDIYNNKNIISSVREEKNRIRDEIIKKYDKTNNEVKNESKYINGRETSYYKCRRGKNPFDRIRKTIKNSINRVRSRIRGLSFEVQLFRQIIISKATGKINYGEWKRKRVNGIVNSNKKSIKSHEKYSKSNNHDFSEWFDSLELNIKEFCIPYHLVESYENNTGKKSGGSKYVFK